MSKITVRCCDIRDHRVCCVFIGRLAPFLFVVVSSLIVSRNGSARASIWFLCCRFVFGSFVLVSFFVCWFFICFFFTPSTRFLFARVYLEMSKKRLTTLESGSGGFFYLSSDLTDCFLTEFYWIWSGFIGLLRDLLDLN